ncbi:hypothetical protein JW906_14925 [bacterium]|nr:hypothetical protein [bacterium]
MMRKILISIGKITGGICLGAAIAFLFGWLVMLLWNWLMPDLFGLTVISFWQAWGLVLLSHILFKAGGHSFRGDHHEPPWKSHFKKKVSEQLLEGEGSAKPREA